MGVLLKNDINYVEVVNSANLNELLGSNSITINSKLYDDVELGNLIKSTDDSKIYNQIVIDYLKRDVPLLKIPSYLALYESI